MNYTVKKVADLAGISVRTLHYYDQIGLLAPSFVKSNGYRYYSEGDLARLQQILFFRELEFSLDQIKEMMDDKDFDSVTALGEQKKLLLMKRKRMDLLVKTIDITIQSRKGGDRMSDDQVFKGFDEEQLEKYKEEAKKRWGHTDAWKQSQERTKNWTKADKERIAKEGEMWTQKFAGLREKGFVVNSPEVQKMIEEHYNGLRRFYEPNPQMYKNLGQMFVDDPRFTAYYDRFGEGLAVFMRDAMLIFANTQ
jgi:DNA-binding transcriptional MerR regulator